MPRVINRVTLAPLAWTLASGLKLWMRTLRGRVIWEDERCAPSHATPLSFLISVWHENILYPGWRFGGHRPWVVISQSHDGEFITRVVQRLGWRVVRGSSSRGGAGAVRSVLRRRDEIAHLTLTVDGPRGPRRQVKQGIVKLAQELGLPIVPAGLAYSHCRRARSWDRLALPLPFSRTVVFMGRPESVPTTLTDANYAAAIQHIQTANERADRLAEVALAGEDAVHDLMPNEVRAAA